MSNYLPSFYELPAVLAGDTFPGLTITSITIDGAAPTNSLASARLDFRTTPDAAAASLSLNSTSNGITIDNAATWGLTVSAFAVTLTPDIYYYDLETTDSAGTVRTYLQGHWKVMRDVTRT